MLEIKVFTCKLRNLGRYPFFSCTAFARECTLNLAYTFLCINCGTFSKIVKRQGVVAKIPQTRGQAVPQSHRRAACMSTGGHPHDQQQLSAARAAVTVMAGSLRENRGGGGDIRTNPSAAPTATMPEPP